MTFPTTTPPNLSNSETFGVIIATRFLAFAAQVIADLTTLGTTLGGGAPVRVAHAQSPFTPTTSQSLFVDVSGGAVNIVSPAVPADGQPLKVKNVNGDASEQPITMTGAAFEDPNNLGTYIANGAATPAAVKVKGGSVDWKWDATNTRWTVTGIA